MLKVQCPVGGMEGSLETRGGSQRVVHYMGRLKMEIAVS